MWRSGVCGWPRLYRYGFAVASGFVVIGVWFLLSKTMGFVAPGVLFVPAVMASAWYGGLFPGLVTTAIGSTFVWFVLDSPQYSLMFRVENTLAFVICWAATVAGVSCLTSQKRKCDDRLKKLNGELELRVALRTKSLQEANDYLRRMCSNMVHDLRAPLRAMASFSQILHEELGTQLNESCAQCLSRIEKASIRMDQLINDLLAHATLQTREIELKTTDVDRCVRRAVAKLENLIFESGAKVTVEYPLGRVWANPELVDMIATELVTNAIKFHRDGVLPQIRLWSERVDHVSRLWVEDNGVGIGKEYQSKIFEVFERLQINDGSPGTGMGLALVRVAVDKIHGRIGVESEGKDGSRFWVDMVVDTPYESRARDTRQKRSHIKRQFSETTVTTEP